MESTSSIPLGYCQCGCGERTAPNKRTYSRWGVYKGEPQKYIKGHQRKSDPRTHYKVEERGYETPCWMWQLSTWHGYGVIRDKGSSSTQAHRLYYEKLRGPIPKNTHLHHLCENRACVNPDHLEQTTRREHTSLHVRSDSRSKLTLDSANEIRRLYAAGGVSQTTLAQEFSVSQAVISRVVRNELWL